MVVYLAHALNDLPSCSCYISRRFIHYFHENKIIFSIFSCGGIDPLGNHDVTTKRRTPRYVAFFSLSLFSSLLSSALHQMLMKF